MPDHRRKRLRISVCTQLVVLLAAVATGALVPTAFYQPLLWNVRREAELSSTHLLQLMDEVNEIRVELAAVQHRSRVRDDSSGKWSAAPNYTAIDLVIDDPPSDAAIRSLYFELAYETD